MTNEQLREYAIERLKQEGTVLGFKGVYLEYYIGLKLNELIEDVKKWRDECYANIRV